MSVAERLAKVLESLDRVCSACMAARTRNEWEFLHRNRACPAARIA